jgi:hypothetical protein
MVSLRTSRSLVVIKAFLLAFLVQSCSGGGGGDGGGGSGDDDSKLGRTSSTGVRVLHASLDETPVQVLIDGAPFQSARYAQVKNYLKTSGGAHPILIHRTNAPAEVISSFSTTFKEDSEYSLLIYGLDERQQVAMLEEPIMRPETGRADLAIVNALSGDSDSLLVSCSDGAVTVATGPAEFGQASQRVSISNLVQQCSVREGNRVVSIVSFTPPDRGEATVVVSGDEDDGIVTVRVYQDLD